MKKWLAFLSLLVMTMVVNAQNRFPKPDFESGYQYTQVTHAVPNETLWAAIDIAMLVILMSVVAWAVLKKRVRTPIIAVSLVSVSYFGFFRAGCVCSIGSIQNVALAMVDQSYIIPIGVLLMFALPIVFTLLFGRVFCAGVCPFGALQELVNIKNHHIPRAIATTLSIIPWIYLILAILLAVSRGGFIICQYDPFIGIFRLGGDMTLIFVGVALLIISIFTGRPFCRFICPYGALLSLFSRVSVWKMKITPVPCINCELCHNACPIDAIRPPHDNKVNESRAKGVKRILIYFVVIPCITIAGAFVMRYASEPLSTLNKDVRLYQMVIENERNPQENQSFELQSFYGKGGSLEKLEPQVMIFKEQFTRNSTIAGAFIGLIIGVTFISLSIKRTRKTYEIDDANCVNCAKCMKYCPQDKMTNETPINPTTH